MAPQTREHAAGSDSKDLSEDGKKNTGNGTGDPLGQSFTAAIRAAAEAPHSVDAWSHLEDLADSLQRPDEVAAAYREALEGDIERDVWMKLSKRAAQFHEEWFGDEPEALYALLSMILERDPAADWAYDRLTMALTLGERWDDLLALYDRVLYRTADPARRKQLLEDAALAAKDFAHKPGRAVDYMQMQLELDSGNHKLAAAIERLLERQRRWEDLIELRQNRLPELTPAEARSTRLEIARTFLHRLDAAAPALEELRALLNESPGHAEGCEELEHVLAGEDFGDNVRTEALGLLRSNYEAAANPAAVIRAVERALTFTEGTPRLALRREAGVRLAILGQDTEAVAHYAALLCEDPADTDARRQLRQLARRSGLTPSHVDALVAAAEHAEPAQSAVLLVEAAGLCRTALELPERATEIYLRVLPLADADPQMALAAAHQLAELLADDSRQDERLDVLEQLAELEPAAAVRRAVLGEVGRLADALDDPDRALAAYRRRLEADANDLPAVDATIDILTRRERWEPLCQALRHRADAVTVLPQRRADLVALARVQSDRLDALPESIATWMKIRTEFGDEPETIAALDGLMAKAARFEEAAEMLDDAAAFRRHEAASLLTRLGDVHRLHLDRPAEATAFYAQALGVESSDPGARAGLKALCDDPTCAGEAARSLVTAYQVGDEWELILGLLELRLTAAPDTATAVDRLREAARLQEERGRDPGAAAHSIGRALGFDPDSTSLQATLNRLATASEQFADAALALGNAAAAAGSPTRAAELLVNQAQITDDQLEHAAAAVAVYAAAAERCPDDLTIARALARTSARAGSWEYAATAALGICRTRGMVDQEVITLLSDAAQASDSWTELARAMEQALEAPEGLTRVTIRDLNLIVLRWQAEQCADLPAAEAAARRALELDQGYSVALDMLAQVQRQMAGSRLGSHPPLCDTLVAIDAGSTGLDALLEAAKIAVEADAEPSLVRTLLTSLVRKAGRLCASDAGPRGTAEDSDADDPRSTLLWALDQRVLLDVSQQREADAIATLQAAAALPLPRADVVDLRIRAARLCASIAAYPQAIDLLGRAVEERDADLELVRELASHCEREGRTLELLGARGKELTLTTDPARRLELRLELSRLAGEIERVGGRVESLRANLDDKPGHAPTIAALSAVLADKGRLDQLADILSDQAQMLEDGGADERSAELWTDTANLVEEQFHDVARATAALEHVVSLAPNEEALDNLARLHSQQDQPAKAAAVLARRLATTEAAGRVPVLLRLARAQLAAGLNPEATQTLQVAFDEAPRSKEARKLLMKQYRDGAQWERLARTLTRAGEHVTDAQTVLAYAREAAEIYHDRLGAPEQAVPILERANALFPEDRKLLAPLAVGLRVANRLDDAAAVLTQLIETFGRRRSTERAAAHLEFARVARARGDESAATDQLELATSMDATNPAILQTLAELARADGQLDRAERAYRTLLIQVRRRTTVAGPPGPRGDRSIGAAEVLYELSKIAAERGDAEQGQELVESAMEVIAEEETEGLALADLLRARGDTTLLRRVLDARLLHADTPRRRAEVLCELADLQEADLDEGAALDSRLKALRADPASPNTHARARTLAAKLGRVDEYLALAEALLEKARRSSDVYVRCELLLRLGEAMAERENHGRAAELIGQAEELEVREVDVWRSAARVAAARHDTDAQMAYLERLAALGEEETETRADALYRMAEVYLTAEDTVERGIVMLSEALEAAPRNERACRILARATAEGSQSAELLALYERVARKTGDDTSVLAAIERRAHHPDTHPEDVREGVELALRLGNVESAEMLMLRAIELAGTLIDAQERVTWAMLGLAERRHDDGDVAGAVKWLCEAIESVPDPLDLLGLAQRVAAPALAEGGDLTLAVKVYETLVERDGASPEIWRPLAELYRRLGDLDQLHRLVEDTIDSIEEPEQRNALRLELAQTLLAESREDDAVEVLRNVLLETPAHPIAQPLLARVFEAGGREDELVGLLGEQLMAAQQRGDDAAIVATSLQIAAHQADDRAAVIATLEGALDYAPTDAGLLAGLAKHLHGHDQDDEGGFEHRAGVLERLIDVAAPEAAAAYAAELARDYLERGDEAGQLRALVAGYSRCPTDVALRTALESAYKEKGDHRGLVDLLLRCAAEETDAGNRVALFRQAAVIQRDQLSDPHAAADVLARAHAAAPKDAELALELAHALAAAGEIGRATGLVSGLLENPDVGDAVRLDLLAARATLRDDGGSLDGVIDDLEAAMAIDPAPVIDRLFEALERRREQRADGHDPETDRADTIRLSELAMLRDDRGYAKMILTEWVDFNRKDAEALRALRDICVLDEDWDAVAKLCARQVAVESGPEQVEAAMMLSEACRRKGEPGEARAGLEHARRKQPQSKHIRDELRDIYATLGADLELAKILLAEAEETEEGGDRLTPLRRAAALFVGVGELDAAMPAIEEILALAPGDPDATLALADLHLANGDAEAADTVLDAALADPANKRGPVVASLFQRQARVAGMRGDAQAQLALLQQAFTAHKSDGDIAAELADLAEVLEEWDLAVRVLRTITLLDTPCPISRVQGFLRQAQICLHRGDRQRAMLWARKAKHEDPEDLEVAQFLATVGES